MAHTTLDQDDYEIAAHPRWRLRIGLGVLGAALVGYWLSPYAGVARFALVANAGDTAALVTRIDLPALRSSFARQIVRTYIARQPQTRSLDPLARQVVASVATGYVDAIIAEHLTPAAIAALISARRTGTPADGLLGQGATLPRLNGLSAAWTLFSRSGFDGLASFAVALPAREGTVPEDGYRLRFRLGDFSWKLAAVDLPQAALNRLADELKTRTDRGS